MNLVESENSNWDFLFIYMALHLVYKNFILLQLQEFLLQSIMLTIILAFLKILATWEFWLKNIGLPSWQETIWFSIKMFFCRSHERDDIQRKSRPSQSVESQDNTLVVNSKSQCSERSVLEPQASKPVMYYMSPAASGSAHSSYFLAPSDTKTALKGSYAL